MPRSPLRIIPPSNDYDGTTDSESASNTPVIIPEHLKQLYSSMNNYTMMTDGIKNRDEEVKTEVLDIAEIIAKAIQ